jgi:general secretion pathway protein J
MKPLDDTWPGYAEKGFTLLELLISLTIVSIIVLLIFSALRIGIRAWEKGEKDIDFIQQKRIVREMLEKQLKSVVPYRINIKENNKDVLLFRGDESTLEFVSSVSFNSNNRITPVYVRCAFEPGPDNSYILHWVEREYTAIEKDRWPAEIEKDQYHEIMGDIKNGTIEYLKRIDRENSQEWTNAWDPLVETALPAAVRITIETDRSPEPLWITARILSEEGDP